MTNYQPNAVGTEIETPHPDQPEILPQRSPDVFPGGPERVEPKIHPDIETSPAPEIFPQHSPDATPARPPMEIPPLSEPLHPNTPAPDRDQ